MVFNFLLLFANVKYLFLFQVSSHISTNPSLVKKERKNLSKCVIWVILRSNILTSLYAGSCLILCKYVHPRQYYLSFLCLSFPPLSFILMVLYFSFSYK